MRRRGMVRVQLIAVVSCGVVRGIVARSVERGVGAMWFS
jgi:hypothetical protein